MLGALLRNQSGAAASEYALVVALIGTPIAIAALWFGVNAADADPTSSFVGPNGTRYRCTAHCQYEDFTYCTANRNPTNNPDLEQYSPALPPITPGQCPMS